MDTIELRSTPSNEVQSNSISVHIGQKKDVDGDM